MQRGTEGEEEAVSRGSKCRDCGNQAKKECLYSRCRTCCKNKGFNCQTHIKSTWTPVDRRRTKDNNPSSSPHNFHPDFPQNHNQINPYSGLEMKFPCATSSMAMFRCVQVRSVDDAVNEIAYQTSVNIGGHVFSGILYDQGPEQSYNINKGESSTALVDEHQNNSLGLLKNSSSRESSGVTIASAGHGDPLFPPPPYPFPLASFRPGMPYFTYPRS
ncbi:protein SHI RELATED SEQUENCE 3-like [Vigna umbellata]|uniref:protein SHI RELATED SEQUENCE 3-like n=1 Tax=Vigna umbellata TaxID=87088 RepID=UPI001F5F96B9|nr:protein SHI RELATED SEQUENCE 3-like [Vigna umbellata]